MFTAVFMFYLRLALGIHTQKRLLARLRKGFSRKESFEGWCCCCAAVVQLVRRKVVGQEVPNIKGFSNSVAVSSNPWAFKKQCAERSMGDRY
jgi:hypothetical protein